METETTLDRIIYAALSLYNRQGVRKTTLEDVATKAGITRITVYRHFGAKKLLVRAVCMKIAGFFQQAAEPGPAQSMADFDKRLGHLGLNIYDLPPGNLLGWMEEVSRVYPEVYGEFRDARQRAIDDIFQQALETASRAGNLRDDLNREVLKAIFSAGVVGLLENPALISSNVPLAEIFSTVTDVFRFGILKNTAERAIAHG